MIESDGRGPRRDKKVTSGMSDPSLEERIRAELLVARKRPDGLTVEALADSPTISGLLGNGDPYIAFTRLGHEVLDSDLSVAVKAAAASLGLLADGDTHLKRLDAFGAEVGLEQRQVRRYSDNGVRILARLIATNWPTETVPRVAVTVVRASQDWEVQIATSRLLIISMREPQITVLRGEDRSEMPVIWSNVKDERSHHVATAEPLLIARTDEEISLVVSWRGELWPKFDVVWIGSHIDAASESLGNKLMLRLARTSTFGG